VNNFYCFQRISWHKILPCYFLYGQEEYLARVFLKVLKQNLVSEGENCPVEKFDLKNISWTEVLDMARMNPVLFSSWRLIIIQGGLRSEGGEERKTSGGRLSEPDKKIIQDYLTLPTPGTVVIVIITGEGRSIKKTSLFRFFSSFSRDQVQFVELKASLAEKKQWLRKRLASQGQMIEEAAIERLIELVGPDLDLLHQEIEKIALFAADKKMISLDDVNQVTGWVAEVDAWELEECLERGKVEGCISVCHRLLAKGVREEYILHQIIKFFRNVFLAKQLLQEGEKRKEIFRQIKPYIQEKYSFYPQKFEGFFYLVDHLNFKKIEQVFQKLKEVDLAVKSTGLPGAAVFENFFFEFGRIIHHG
jgi:DNA polymerase-3 subunit delta